MAFDFSLRFYGQTEEGVNLCIAELMAVVPEILDHRFETPSVSMNALQKPSHQVFLSFENEAVARKAMVGNKAATAVYRSHASRIDAPFRTAVREAGNKAFGH